nr:hypothetical protein [Deltaproteobacteria bacterium]
VMDKARVEQGGTCVTPTVFKSQLSSGYGLWASYAASVGRAGEWRAWSEDEPCAQRGVTTDTESTVDEGTPYCELEN